MTSTPSWPAFSLKYDIYTQDSAGERVAVGHAAFNRGDGVVSGKQQMAWNNRQAGIDMRLVIGDGGIPTRMVFKGTNPLGAPVEEEFTFEDGVSSWVSINERGSARTPQPLLYMPSVYSPMIGSMFVRALLADQDRTLDVLPQGQVRLETLDQFSVEEGGRRETVHLHALSGAGLIPEFGWTWRRARCWRAAISWSRTAGSRGSAARRSTPWMPSGSMAPA